MKLSVAHLRAAGLTDSQIVRVLLEAEAEHRQKARIVKRNQRSRPPKTQDKKVATPASRRRRLTPDWQPDERDRSYAISKGWNDARIDVQAERFRHYWIGHGKPMANWHSTWCNWVTSEYQQRRAPAQPLRDRNREIVDELEEFIRRTDADAKPCRQDAAQGTLFLPDGKPRRP